MTKVTSEDAEIEFHWFAEPDSMRRMISKLIWCVGMNKNGVATAIETQPTNNLSILQRSDQMGFEHCNGMGSNWSSHKVEDTQVGKGFSKFLMQFSDTFTAFFDLGVVVGVNVPVLDRMWEAPS